MYWAIFHVPTYFSNCILPQPIQTCITIPDEQDVGKSVCEEVHEIQHFEALSLNLSAQDLIQAGFSNQKTPWTEEQDKRLKMLRDDQQLDWCEMAKLMPGRNSKMCYSRYRRLENNPKEGWKKKDDELLIELVSNLGQDWKQISKYFPKKTSKQIKEHYMNYLRPEINKEEWSLDEDLKLVDCLNRFGKNWKVIEQQFQGRTQNQIKNRYFGRLKRLAEKKEMMKDKCQQEIKNS